MPCLLNACTTQYSSLQLWDLGHLGFWENNISPRPKIPTNTSIIELNTKSKKAYQFIIIIKF